MSPEQIGANGARVDDDGSRNVWSDDPLGFQTALDENRPNTAMSDPIHPYNGRRPAGIDLTEIADGSTVSWGLG